MKTYKIEYDLTQLKELVDNFAKGMTTAALPKTNAAFQEAALYIQESWRSYLGGELSLPGCDTPSKVTSAMVNSIRTKNLTNEKEFHAVIFSDNRQVEELNRGRPDVEYDMKKTHPYGNKSRVSKKGIPYLIIPFRWGTGKKRAHFNNFIPQKIYNVAVKGTNISFVKSLKDHIEKNAKGEDVWRWGYDWVKGSRLSDDLTASDDRMKGMVRMLDDRRKDVRDSEYFTFRIISAKSPAGSWIYKRKGTQGNNYMQALENYVKPEIDRIINEGIQKDIKDIQNDLR